MKQYIPALVLFLCILLGATAAVWIRGYVVIEGDRQKLEEIIIASKHKQASLQELQSQLTQQTQAIEHYQSYRDAWAPRIREYSNEALVLNHLRQFADEEKLHIGRTEGTDKTLPEAGAVTEIHYEVTGSINNILAWLNKAETEIDFLQCSDTHWTPQPNSQLQLEANFIINFKLFESDVSP